MHREIYVIVLNYIYYIQKNYVTPHNRMSQQKEMALNNCKMV